MSEPETPFAGGSHSEAVRVGGTVRRVGRPWSADVLDLLRHLDSAGFEGAPRALGFDERGREVLSFVDGESSVGVPSDAALVRFGGLLREFHDAAASFGWAGRTWQVPVRQPVETMCHNDLNLGNVMFRHGEPVALIDWEAAAPGPRAWDLGYAAWYWVPFSVYGSVTEQARRFRLLLDGYGVEPTVDLLRTGVERMRQYLDHLRGLEAAGSAWEMARRDQHDELAREIAWVDEHAAALVG